ncbi:MAG: hypothetical protein Q8O35_10505 [Humidesulfovibrio sp.]|uniref:hypothetical protein n=1 Tax=Humidesulfovibrio sp. TaxID=2910988 RepID=UPI0027359D82|nr:hypothetical protein [Humidesulfovibrio sp.]MDP2848605.1 hypothetical protein [Humidesulfovibrio sp.]
MQTVDSLERDYVSALTNIFERIPQAEYSRPVQLGEEYTLTEEKRLVFRPLILVEKRAVSYRDTLRCLDPKTITEAGVKDLSLRRIENIFKVEANRNTNQDLLAGVDLEISPDLKALEAYRYRVGGLDIRHVPLTPSQDWLGNPDPLLNQRQIDRPISVFALLSRWSGASGESMGALSERLVRFLKHGALHLFEPRQAGPRILYTPSTKDAAAIEIDCAAASLNGWTEGSQVANDLSRLFADMAEVEALEAQYDSLKPIASDNSGQESEQVVPLARGEAKTEAKPAEVRQKRLRVTQKVAAVLCDVTERQVGKWDKGVQRPERYPGRHDLAVLTAWAETYKQGKLVASAARAANHPSTAEGWMLENLSDDGSGDPAAVLEEHEQNQNRKRKL